MATDKSQEHTRELVRSALIARLEEDVLLHRLTVLRAPAGYGKSTVLRQTVQLWQQRGVAVAWPEITMASCAKKLHFILSDLATGTRPSVLVLDDLHTVPVDEWARTIATVSASLPSSIHVVLVVRTQLPDGVLSADANMKSITLRAEELRFTPSECLSLFVRWHSRQGAASWGREVHRLTDGWPVAVNAVARASAGVGDRAASIFKIEPENPLARSRTWERYVREHFVDAEPRPVQALLRASALLVPFDAELCDAVLGRTDSRAIIEELVEREVLRRSTDTTTSFHHHPFIAETLRFATHRDDPLWCRSVHHRALRWYLAHGDRRRALAHHLALGNYGQAAALIMGHTSARRVLDPTELFDVVTAHEISLAVHYSNDRPRTSSTPLTEREVDVLGLLAKGLENKEIAAGLFLSVATVKTHISRVFRKLGVTNRTAAVARARANGLL